jgi:phosphohistidine phosphatase
MKLLTLVRHAKSDHGGAVADRDRPLNARGRGAAPDMAGRWSRRGLVPDLLLTSPAVRAATTAALFAHEFGIAADAVRVDERLYLASPGDLLEAIHAAPDTARHVMVFGHNPGLSVLARMLCPALPLGELPTAGVVTLSSAARGWRRFERARLELIACDWPKRAD